MVKLVMDGKVAHAVVVLSFKKVYIFLIGKLQLKL